MPEGWEPVADTSAWSPVAENKPGPVGRFLAPQNPIPLLHALFKPSGNHALDLSGYTLGKNVVDLVGDMGMAQVEEGKKAIEAFHKGDHTEAIARGLSALVPLLGPMSQQAADKFIAGDTAGGFGTLTAMALPEIARKVPTAVRSTAAAVSDLSDKTPPIVAKLAGKLADRVPGVKLGKFVYGAAKDTVDTVREMRADKAAAAEKAAAAAEAPVQPPAPGSGPVRPPLDVNPRLPSQQPAPQARTGPVRPPLASAVEPAQAPPGVFQQPNEPPVVPPGAEAPPAAPDPLAAAPVESTPAPAPVQASPAPGPVSAPPAGSPEAAAAAQALRDEMAASGSLPTEEPPPLADSAAYEAEARHLKSDAVARTLHEHGIPASDLESLPHDDPMWGKLFEGIGEHGPGKYSGDAKATIGQTIVKLKAMERSTRAKEAAGSVPAAATGDILPGNEQPAAKPAAASGEVDQVSKPSESSGGGGAEADRRQETVVHVPGSDVKYPARYQVKELADVQGSHSGQTFQSNPKYSLTNDRDYSRLENRGKVLHGSQPDKFQAAFHITDNPDATNGPIVIDSTGNALGGNGRKMILDRVYGSGGPAATQYRSLLEQKAGQFGIDPEQVKGMKQPVLVREIADEHLADTAARQKAVTDFNVSGTASLTPAERAITDSRRVSSSTLDHIAGRLEAEGGNATLANVLKGSGGAEVLKRLVEDGVVPLQEKAAFESGGVLTKAGTQRIQQLMLGRFFRDPAQIENIAPIVKMKLERMAAPLAQVEGAGEWNLTPRIHEAMDLLEEAHSRGISNIDDVVKQSGLFGDTKFSPEGVRMAKLLQKGSAKQLTEAARQYAQHAGYALHGESLFGDPPTPETSFLEAFDKKAAAKPKPAAEPVKPATPLNEKAQAISSELADMLKQDSNLGDAMKRKRK